MSYPNNPTSFEFNPKLHKHGIELLLAGDRQSICYYKGGSPQEVSILWEGIKQRGGYLSDGRQVLWMATRSEYPVCSYWVNRDLDLKMIKENEDGN